jgi:ubiquinone/menaquinone biosynthesis C-methylase UbiE
MAIFRRSQGEPLAVVMTGVKLGDRFLSLGVRDPKLIAALAVKQGLTGRAAAVDADATRVADGGRALEAEGALVEVLQAPWGRLPFGDASFDIAVARDVLSILDSGERRGVVSEAARVLRGGGRLVVIESTKRTRVDPQTLTTALAEAGFAAVRVLAEAEHTLFVEGIKKSSVGG